MAEPQAAGADQFVVVGTCATSGKEITICYQTLGDSSNPCLLLISGLGSTCLTWRDALCSELVRAGFFVVRFDNRDVGLSTHLDGVEPAALWRLSVPHWLPTQPRTPPYRLEDMAADAFGLLDALHIDRAHIFGASMGGMIAQLMAIAHPHRVRSLSLLYTSAEGLCMSGMSLSVSLSLFDKPRSDSPEDVLEWKVRQAKRFTGGYDLDVDAYEKHSQRNLQRAAEDINGKKRQTWAAHCAAARHDELRHLREIPAVVMHGMKDTTIPFAKAEQLATDLPRARLVLFPQMGHFMPPELFADIVAEVASNLFSSP